MENPPALCLTARAFFEDFEGHPTPFLSIDFQIKNQGSEDVFIPCHYGESATIRTLSPASAFEINKKALRPSTLIAPQSDNVIRIPPGESIAVGKGWPANDIALTDENGNAFSYALKQPGKIAVRACFSVQPSAKATALSPFVPKGKSIWIGDICAESVEIDIGSLSKGNVEEIKFTGVISNIHFGVRYDGDNSITVGGKRVVYAIGGERAGGAKAGRLIGFALPHDTPSDNFDGFNGRRVEVYARVDYASGPFMEHVPQYSVVGDSKYYMKLLGN